MLVTRAIALQGMDFSPRLTGLQGLWGIEQTQTVIIPGGSGGGKARGYYAGGIDEQALNDALQSAKRKRTDQDILNVLTLFVLGQNE